MPLYFGMLAMITINALVLFILVTLVFFERHRDSLFLTGVF